MAKIKRLRVQEVSLAAFPKNGKKFIIVKDNKEGGFTMDRILSIMSFLSTKSADVPEVVKEELKAINKDISTADVLEVFKDLLIGYLIEQKKDGLQVVDTLKFDVLAKDSWIKKPEPEFKLPEAIQKELDDNRKTIESMLLKEFTKEVSDKVGEALAATFSPLFGKVDAGTMTKVLDIVKFQQDIINELGKAHLVPGVSKKAADVTKAVEALAKERNIAVVDAWAVYAKENPDSIASLDN